MMKRLVYTSLLIAGLMAASMAHAQEPATDEVPKDKPIAGYDGGFFIQTADGENKIKIKGRVQPQYYFEKGRFGVESVSTFKMRRAQINFSGNISKSWSFFALFQNGTSQTQTKGTLFWLGSVTYSPGDYFSMEMGMVDPQFDRLSMGSSGTFMFVENPLVATQEDGIQDLSLSRPAFGFENGPGIVISGNIKDRFLYGVSVTNGTNPTGNSTFTPNFNKRMSGAIRMQYNILKDPGYAESDLGWSETPALAWGVGGGYLDQGSADAYSGVPSATPPILPTIYYRFNLQGTSDLTFKYKGLSILGSVYGRIQYASSLVTNNKLTLHDMGYYGQAGYFVIPKKLEIAARASQMFREGPLNDSSEYDGGINWYIVGNSVKWQNTVGLVRSYDNVGGTTGQRIWRFWSMITMNI